MMTPEQVRHHLTGAMQEDGSLHSTGWYLSWHPTNLTATLDGGFTADQLEAIALWMREHQAPRRKKEAWADR